MCICRLNCNNFASICSSEFTVLVDVTSERSCHIPAVREDDISSLYQFTITSANTQPIDRGEYISLDLICCMFVASVSVTQFTVWEPIGSCLLINPLRPKVFFHGFLCSRRFSVRCFLSVLFAHSLQKVR